MNIYFIHSYTWDLFLTSFCFFFLLFPKSNSRPRKIENKKSYDIRKCIYFLSIYEEHYTMFVPINFIERN